MASQRIGSVWKSSLEKGLVRDDEAGRTESAPLHVKRYTDLLNHLTTYSIYRFNHRVTLDFTDEQIVNKRPRWAPLSREDLEMQAPGPEPVQETTLSMGIQPDRNNTRFLFKNFSKTWAPYLDILPGVLIHRLWESFVLYLTPRASLFILWRIWSQNLEA